MDGTTLTLGDGTGVDAWLAARLQGVDGWNRFDVLAADSATAAMVVMHLRGALPDATVLSAPLSQAPSGHVLTCGAWISGRSPEETRDAVIEAFAELEGGSAGPCLVFEDELAELTAD